MKRVNRNKKGLSGPSRKGKTQLAFPKTRSRSVAVAGTTHVRIGVMASRRLGIGITSRVAASQTDEYAKSEAIFKTAIKSFEDGALAFRKQNYLKAKEIFQKLALTGVAGVAERARIHLRLCEQKLSRPTPPPRNAEELYTLGVGALNSRRIDDALQYLGKALKAAPGREYIWYALAAAYSLRGDGESALHHLAEAIHLRPQNRKQARDDEDFQSLANDARFKELVLNSST